MVGGINPRLDLVAKASNYYLTYCRRWYELHDRGDCRKGCPYGEGENCAYAKKRDEEFTKFLERGACDDEKA